jgi:putative Mg2+ transporter-C (MgtC) family protein
LILLVSKYGFQERLEPGLVVVDPSRVAAQIVTGIGFLGAGIIIFRRGSVHGLTASAAVWESAAIGMAAGAGLLLSHAVHRAVMTALLQACERRNWQLSELSADPTGGVLLTLSGNGILHASTVLAGIDGVTSIRQLDDDPD